MAADRRRMATHVAATLPEAGATDVDLDPDIRVSFMPSMSRRNLRALCNVRAVGMDKNQNVDMRCYGWDEPWTRRPGADECPLGVGLARHASHAFPWLQRLHVVRLDGPAVRDLADPNDQAYDRQNACNRSYYGGCDWSWTRYTTRLPLASRVVADEPGQLKLRLDEPLQPATRYAVLLQHFGGVDGIQSDMLVPFTTRADLDDRPGGDPASDPASDPGGACCVCWSAPADMAAVPCGHLVLCRDDARRITQCPICRAPVESFLRVFRG
jgi:hypothetical protein